MPAAVDRFRRPALPVPVWLAVLLAVFFAGWAVQLNYWGLWLLSRGLTEAEAGVVIAAGLLSRAGVSLLYPAVSARLRPLTTLRVLVLGSVASGTLFLVADGTVALVLVSVLFGATFPVVMPVIETLLSQQAATGAISYGRVRLAGSAGFVAGVGLASAAARLRGPEGVVDVMLVICGLLVVHVLLFTSRIDQAPVPGDGSSHRRTSWGMFACVLVVAALVQGSHGAYYLLAALPVEAAVRTPFAAGAVFAVAVVCEIVGFRLFGRLGDDRAIRLLLVLGALAAVVRWSVVALVPGLWGILVTQPLHALTFAGIHFAYATYVRGHVSPDRWAFAHGCYAALSMGLAVSLATLVAGVAARYPELSAAYWWMAAAACPAVLLASSLARHLRRSGQRVPARTARPDR